MTRLAKLLKNRVWVMQATKEPLPNGGFERGYKALIQVWSALTPIAQASIDISHFAAQIRGTQVNSTATHKLKVRRVAVQDVGAAFSDGFNRGFAKAGSLQILKSEYFIFEPRGGTNGAFAAGFSIGFNQTEGLIGDLYRIVAGVDNNSDREYLEIRLMAIEEQGTGAPA